MRETQVRAPANYRRAQLPAVIFHAVTLSCGKQTENRASRPARPINRGCAEVFVGPGVTIDEGAILEAGPVVLKDVKPWMIVIENTARESKDARLLNERAIRFTGTLVSAYPSQE